MGRWLGLELPPRAGACTEAAPFHRGTGSSLKTGEQRRESGEECRPSRGWLHGKEQHGGWGTLPESPGCSPEATGPHGSYALGRLTSLCARPRASAQLGLAYQGPKLTRLCVCTHPGAGLLREDPATRQQGPLPRCAITSSPPHPPPCARLTSSKVHLLS